MPGAGPIVGGLDPEDGGRADSLLGRFRAALAVRWWRLLGDRHAHLRPAVRLLRRSPLFDADWYRATYADVTAARIDPALHYAAYGHAEGRDPGPDFSTRAYLARYRDVARSGINALLHYETHGRGEGRQVIASATLSPIEATQAKEDFRQACRLELHAFLAGTERIVLPAADAPVVSIVLVLHNQAELTYKCLRSLEATLDVPAQIIVVDNASNDATVAMLDRVDNIERLDQAENLHFLRGANAGAARARAPCVLFLNNDTTVGAGAISTAIRVLQEHPGAGVVGGKILTLDGRLQEAGCIVMADGTCAGYGRGADPSAGEYQFRREVDFCSGAFLLVRRALFEQLGGFDPLFVPAYYEEVDLCMRARAAGYGVLYDPRVVITHFEYGSATEAAAPLALMRANQGKFLARYAAVLVNERATDPDFLLARTHGPRCPRVLFLDDQVPLPDRGGGLPRARAFVCALFESGAFVTHYPVDGQLGSAEQTRAVLPLEIEIAGGAGRYSLAGFLSARAGYYDLVVISRPHNMLLFNEACEEAELRLDCPVIYDAESIFALREAAGAALGLRTSGSAMTLDQELALARAARTVLAVNQAEAERFRAAGCGDVRVLGHRLPPMPGVPGTAGRRDLLFVGRLEETGAPNADSIRWFVSEVMPRLDALLGTGYVLHVVGGCAESIFRTLGSERVRFHGRVADLRPFYAAARVFIAPTRFAAGIAHKVHEAANSGVPVVATRLIAGQLGWRDGEDLLAADDPEAFAQACAGLYEDALLWKRLQANALDRVGQECAPGAFDATVRSLLKDIEPRPAARPRQAGSNDERRARVARQWSVDGVERAAVEGQLWLAHPLVRARMNRMASGHPEVDMYAHLAAFLRARGWSLPVARAASLCSGFGELERGLIEGGLAARVDGYELAPAAVEKARELAQAGGLTGLHYHLADLESAALPEGAFDLVFAHSGMHHIDNLDGLFAAVRRSLRPGGIFHLFEYVGPDRFQWTARQLEAINEFTGTLPPAYRLLPSGMQRGWQQRPTVNEVIAVDPSEAIRSSGILPALRRHFRVLEQRDLGGALLHIGLSGIAQNFDPALPTDVALIEGFFQLEDKLMADGEIGSDFAVFIVTPDDHAPAVPD